MKNQVAAKEVETCLKGAGGASCDQHNSNKPGSSMASAELQTAHSNARVNVCDYNLLHNYFLHMFETSEETNPVKEKTKKNKKSKKCPGGRKDKRTLEPLSGLNSSVPEIKINRNASWFAMFASVRRTCLEHQSRAATLLQVRSVFPLSSPAVSNVSGGGSCSLAGGVRDGQRELGLGHGQVLAAEGGRTGAEGGV